MTKVEVATALKFLDSHRGLKQFSKKFRKEVRYYHCPLCNWWHLTSKNKEVSSKKEREIIIIHEERWKKLLNNNEDVNDNN